MPLIGGRSYIDRGLQAVEREFDENAEEGLPKVRFTKRKFTMDIPNWNTSKGKQFV
mgnify:CR=1 FL=1